LGHFPDPSPRAEVKEYRAARQPDFARFARGALRLLNRSRIQTGEAWDGLSSVRDAELHPAHPTYRMDRSVRSFRNTSSWRRECLRHHAQGRPKKLFARGLPM